MPSKTVKQCAPSTIHSEWHHHPRLSKSPQQQQLTHAKTRNRRWMDSAPGTHCDCHHQQQGSRRVSRYSSRASSQTPWTRRRDTPPPPPVQSHGNGTRPQPAAGTQRTRSEQSPKEPHAEADPHPSTTRRLTPRGHTECTVSSIELIRRPSL
ncbi:hypothetical protein TcCL_Unassigned05088 [Trypanosoma cruzi]|nr:hypothetical protein TcCL_Unassigned05088 [Trypanosoma cruzi]